MRSGDQDSSSQRIDALCGLVVLLVQQMPHQHRDSDELRQSQLSTCCPCGLREAVQWWMLCLWRSIASLPREQQPRWWSVLECFPPARVELGPQGNHRLAEQIPAKWSKRPHPQDSGMVPFANACDASSCLCPCYAWYLLKPHFFLHFVQCCSVQFDPKPWLNQVRSS